MKDLSREEGRLREGHRERVVGREKKDNIQRRGERQSLKQRAKRWEWGGNRGRKEKNERRRGGEREVETAFHSHAIILTREFSVLSRRNTYKSSSKHPWKLKPVQSCQTAPSAPVFKGVGDPGALFLRPCCQSGLGKGCGGERQAMVEKWPIRGTEFPLVSVSHLRLPCLQDILDFAHEILWWNIFISNI